MQAEIASRSLGRKETLDVIKRLTKEAFENESDEIKMEIQQELDDLKAAVPNQESDELPTVPTPAQRQMYVFSSGSKSIHINSMSSGFLSERLTTHRQC